jgi:hypothetical protein
VYFSIFIVCFPQPAFPPRRHGNSIFNGFPQAALIFLNQQAVSRQHGTGLDQMWEGVPKTEEAASQIRVRWRPAAESLKKPNVSDPAGADRQPLSLSRGPLSLPSEGLALEPLLRAAPGARQRLPADRRDAIENGPGGLGPADPKWMSKACFLMLMRDEWLEALRTHLDDASNVLTISRNRAIATQGNLEAAEGRATAGGAIGLGDAIVAGEPQLRRGNAREPRYPEQAWFFCRAHQIFAASTLTTTPLPTHAIFDPR